MPEAWLENMEKILSLVHKYGLRINTIHIEGAFGDATRAVCLHIDAEDVKKLVEDLKSNGFEVSIRNR